MKRCNKCGIEKPLDDFYRDRSRKDGRHPWCKPCIAAKRAAWYERNRETNLAYQAEWREKNKDKKAAGDRAWVAANPQRKREADRLWRLANRAHIDTLIATYRTENPERVTEWRRRRRARKHNAFIAPVSFSDILNRDRGICGICDKPIMEPTIELDHIIPLAAGGTHEPKNIQLAHRTCNRRKSKTLDFKLPDAA